MLTVNSVIYGLQFLFLVSLFHSGNVFIFTIVSCTEPNPSDPLNKGKETRATLIMMQAF